MFQRSYPIAFRVGLSWRPRMVDVEAIHKIIKRTVEPLVYEQVHRGIFPALGVRMV